MPWEESNRMDHRKSLIAAVEAGMSKSEAAERWGVSRKTVYKWLKRYDPNDPRSLHDESRAPRSRPNQTPEEIEHALVAQRQSHPLWGPRKLLRLLERDRRELAGHLPAPSTVSRILKAAGLVAPRKHRRRATHPGTKPFIATEPNALWCIDYKGEFRTSDGRVCYPLTVTDAFSRRILLCDGQTSPSLANAMAAMERLFRDLGLPVAIRSDNGTPFCSQSVCGMTRMSASWVALGSEHQRTRPGSPQDNPTHERMRRDLKAATARPPAANMTAQQERFDKFVEEYNTERPHEALGMLTPDSLWVPSPRPMPAKMPEPVYEGHMLVRSVHHGGTIKFKGHSPFLTEVLIGQRVGLDEVDDGIWAIYFHDVRIGTLNEAKMQITGVPSQR